MCRPVRRGGRRLERVVSGVRVDGEMGAAYCFAGTFYCKGFVDCVWKIVYMGEVDGWGE